MDLIGPVLTFLFIAYIIASAYFIIMDNRQPSSTFAWLLLFIAIPVIGVLIYIFFGRDRKVFADQHKLARTEIGSDLTKHVTEFLNQQEREIQAIRSDPKRTSAEKRLVQMLKRTNLSFLTVHNKLEILQDASVKYPRLEEDIRNAQHSIHLQYFIWEADEYMVKLGDLLIEKAKQGVKVRILYDASGSMFLMLGKRSYVKRLQAGGVQIYPYLNFLTPLKLHTINYRNHRKIAVIDGKIGFTGGMNMGEEHLKGAGPYNAWRDTHLRLTGEAVSVLQADFVIAWYNTTKEKLISDDYFAFDRYPNANLPLQLVGSGPDTEWKAIQQQYFFMIMAAEERVWIQSPFFIPDPSIAEALKAAALSGVDVKLMIAPRDTASPLANWAGNTYLLDMARGGVDVHLYQPGYLHAKTIAVDSSVCSIGSANMDIRSFQVNYEVNTIIYDQGVTAELEAAYVKDLEGCTQFTAEEYLSRPQWQRFRDSVTRLLSPLL